MGLITATIAGFSLFSRVALGGGVTAEFSRCIKLSREHSLIYLPEVGGKPP